MGRFFEPDLNPGKIRFFNNALPTLTSGEYRIRVEQEVDPSGIAALQPPEPVKTFSYDQTFFVEGPRFGLGPGDVHAVYPPPNSQGQFENTLPHIVLRRRSLPWERTIDGGLPNRANPVPWLALLMFHEGELASDALNTLTIDQLANPPAATGAIMRPPVTLSVPEQLALSAAAGTGTVPKGRTIDVDKDLFLKIAPRLDELSSLVHVRQVNTGNKELLGLEEDGWFAVALANRLPVDGLNTVHLVSLEKWDAFLPKAADPQPQFPTGVTKLRLISLASWSFTGLAARGSFKALVSNISIGPLQAPLPRAFPVLPADSSTDNEDVAVARLFKGALESGYVPLAYDMRQGEHTVAWYRGPLLPVVTPRGDRAPFPTAEAGLIYDRRTAMFDVSYAVAWQIGRLLALADQKYSAGLSEWRQGGHRVLDAILEKQQVAVQFLLAELWVSVGKVEAEPDPQKKIELAQKLLDDLNTPGVLSTRLARLVLDQFSAKQNLKRATMGTVAGPYNIAQGASDTLKIRVASGGPISVTLTAGTRRTTDQIVTDLNGNAAFAEVARAERAQDIDGPVAIFTLDESSRLTVLNGTANVTLGFTESAAGAPVETVPAADGPVLMNAAPDTKTRLVTGIADAIARVDTSDIKASEKAAAVIRDRILALIP